MQLQAVAPAYRVRPLSTARSKLPVAASSLCPLRASRSAFSCAGRGKRLMSGVEDVAVQLGQTGAPARQRPSRGVGHVTRASSAAALSEQGSSGGSAGSVMPFVLVASLGAFLFGYHLGVVNAALEPLAAELGITAVGTKGAVVSSVLLGAFGGSLAGGTLADRFGRRGTFIRSGLPLVIGTILCATATGATAMLAGRFICGIGIGIASGVVPVYINEISPPAVRGALGSVNQLSICTGVLGALVAGLPLSSDPSLWRACFAFALVPAVLHSLLAAVYAPETPQWLVRQGRKADADAAARRLWGPGAQAESDGDAAGGKAAAGNWAELFGSQYGALTLAGGGLFFLQQLSGINAVVFFSNAIFRQAGIASDTLASATVGAVNVIGTFVASIVLDKFGRKPMLCGSFSGMFLSMAALSAASLPALSHIAAPLSLIGTLVYVGCFALGAGPIPALLVSELFPARLRGKAQAVAMGTHWIFNFFIGQTFLLAVSSFGVGRVYAFFSTVCVVAVVFIMKMVPETRGGQLAPAGASRV